MAENSKIEWTKHTWNPWEGCTKLTPACDHCYAEARNERFAGGGNWGAGAPRRRTSLPNWNKPYRWNRIAAERGERHRVFCLSLGDWADKEVDPQWRSDAFRVIEETPNLDWLLLTKRHQLAKKYLPAKPWQHVRIGFTVEDNERALMRLPALGMLALRGWKTFVSYEPALGPVNWSPWLDPDGIAGGCIQWLICGGESGPYARMMNEVWARDARDICKRAGVPFFMKQMTKKAPIPGDLLIREFPS